MDDPNVQDDALWQAEVLLAHRQSTTYRMIMRVGVIVVLFIGWLVNQMRFSGVVTGVSIAGLSLVGVLFCSASPLSGAVPPVTH